MQKRPDFEEIRALMLEGGEWIHPARLNRTKEPLRTEQRSRSVLIDGKWER